MLYSSVTTTSNRLRIINEAIHIIYIQLKQDMTYCNKGICKCFILLKKPEYAIQCFFNKILSIELLSVPSVNPVYHDSKVLQIQILSINIHCLNFFITKTVLQQH